MKEASGSEWSARPEGANGCFLVSASCLIVQPAVWALEQPEQLVGVARAVARLVLACWVRVIPDPDRRRYIFPGGAAVREGGRSSLRAGEVLRRKQQ